MQNHRLFRLNAAMFLATIAVALPKAAMADCSYYDPTYDHGVVTINSPTPLVARQGRPNGYEIATFRVPIGAKVALGKCDAAGGVFAYVNSLLFGSPVPGLPLVNTTNIPGVGYKVSFSSGPIFAPGTSATRRLTIPPNPNGTVVYDNWGELVVTLITTGVSTGSGRLTPAPIAASNMAGYPSRRYLLAQFGNIEITTPMCDVTFSSENQVVNLGQEYRQRFRGIGSTTKETNFQVTVACQVASSPWFSPMVSMTMDATPDPSNTPGVLRTNTGTGTASGVGIQVLDGKGQPVSFGQPMDVGPIKVGNYVMPFKARYYQVANTVGVGQANGMATVTLSYK